MAVHQMRAPWDRRTLCGRGGEAPKTFDYEKVTCGLCIRSDLAFAERTFHDDCDLDRDSDATATAAHCGDNAVPQDLQARAFRHRPTQVGTNQERYSMTDYTWADDTAYRMRDYYEANRPLRWWEKRNPPGSWGCIADNLMLGLLNIAASAKPGRPEEGVA